MNVVSNAADAQLTFVGSYHSGSMGVIVTQFEFWVELDLGVFFSHFFTIYGAATGTVFVVCKTFWSSKS